MLKKAPELLPVINDRDEIIGSCSKEEAHAKGLLHRLSAEVFKTRYAPHMGGIKLNEEQVKGLWLTHERLQELYRSDLERFSVPSRLTCEKLFINRRFLDSACHAHIK